MEAALGVVSVLQHSMLQHGEGLAVCGLVCGSIATHFGRKRFMPPARNAQYGRWHAARLSGVPLLVVGLVGRILMAIATV